MGTELQTGQAAAPAAQIRETVATIKARVQMVQHVMRDVMKPGVHYGQIPGTPKPTLYKPGAEIIALAFGFAPRYTVDDLSTGDSIRYRVTCELYSRESGGFVGSGHGEASSDEEKYRWRKAVCAEEFAETPEDRKRVKWAKGKGGSTYTIEQVRTEPADIANTVLKMAEKRAFIDAIRTTTGCSDMFSQDLEDLPTEVREGMADTQAPEPVELLGADGWATLVAQAEGFGYPEASVIASGAALGYEGEPEKMPRETAKRLFRAMRDHPANEQEPAAEARAAAEPQQASGEHEQAAETDDDDVPGMDAEAYAEHLRGGQGRPKRSASEMARDLAARARQQESAEARPKGTVTAPQLTRICAQCAELERLGVTETEWRAWLADREGVEHRDELTKAAASRVIDGLQAWIVELRADLDEGQGAT